MLWIRLSHVLLIVTIYLILPAPFEARAVMSDTKIERIVVPYQRNVNSNVPAYQFPVRPLRESRGVLVPATKEMLSTFQLNTSALNDSVAANNSQYGKRVNFVEGAYPVYYMPGNVNGHFNGKISLLTE